MATIIPAPKPVWTAAALLLEETAERVVVEAGRVVVAGGMVELGLVDEVAPLEVLPVDEALDPVPVLLPDPEVEVAVPVPVVVPLPVEVAVAVALKAAQRAKPALCACPRSARLQAATRQGATVATMAGWPVPHWQLRSLAPQPAAPMAEARQEVCS